MKKIIAKGRSMVEMLGVLAIIGVVSVGGVWGIRQLMAKSQAAAILNDVKLYYMTIEENGAKFTEEGDVVPTDFRPQTNYTYVAFSPAEEYYRISVLNVPKSVCHAVLNMAGKNPFEDRSPSDLQNVSKVALLRNNKLEWSKGEDAGLCQEGDNEVMFFFGSVAGACYMPCEEQDTDCYYGTCCSRKKRCNGECCQEGEVCCNGGCNDSYCPTDKNGVQLVKNNVCQCKCPYKSGYATEMVNGACGCNRSKGFELKNGKCVCKEGMVNFDGECVAFGCYTNTNRNTVCTTGASCYCYIGNQKCGYYCSATDTSTCKYGLCNDTCLGNDWEYNPGTQDFACTTADDRFQCEKMNGTLSCMEKGKGYSYYCGRTCHEDGSECAVGDCTDVCRGNTYNGKTGVFGRVGSFWGCQYGNISCYKQSTVTTGAIANQGPKYYCFKDGEVCAQECTKPYPDETCYVNSCDETPCPEGMELNDDGICARNDGVYCQLGWDKSGYWCYLENGEMCGKNCDANGKNCVYGCCDGGDGSACCPSGYSYQRISGYYGCYNPTTKIGCWNTNKTRTTFQCEINGTRCATGCTDVTGMTCTTGSCDARVCTNRGLTFELITNYYGCYNNGAELGCYKYNNSNGGNYYCYIGSVNCGSGCGPNYDGLKSDGSDCGSCRSNIFVCPKENQVLVNEATKGCTNQNGISCFTNGACYVNYGISNGQYRCGTECNKDTLDGTGCKNGNCVPESCTNGSWVYNVSTNLYECQEDSSSLSCVNGICSLGGKKCGAGCTQALGGDECDDGSVTCTLENVTCESGVCRESACPPGAPSIRRATDNFYGCYNSVENTICYPYSNSVWCVKSAQIVGTDCNLDGHNCKCSTGTGKAIVEPNASITVDEAGICNICPKGTCSSADGTKCAGTLSKTQVCMECPKGTYRTVSGTNSCPATSIGFYVVGTGSINQIACPPGTTTPETGYYYDKTDCEDDVEKACGCQPMEIISPCMKNSDCEGENEFCWFKNNSYSHSSGQGQCKKVADYNPETQEMEDGKTWTRANATMNWWSAQNWCLAQELRPATRADIGCGDVPINGYCPESTILNAIRKVWKENAGVHLEDYGNISNAYYVNFSGGNVGYAARQNYYRALCKH